MKNKTIKLCLLNILIVGIVIFSFSSLGKYEILVVDTMALNIRTGPGVSFEIQAQAKRGDKLKVIDQENEWYKVQDDAGNSGWVASWLVTNNSASASTNIKATVNTPDTKLRDEGNTESNVIAELAEGTEVTITLEQEGWSKVKVNNQTGWIHSPLLDVEDQTKSENKQENDSLYARQDDTNIRLTPDVASDVVTKLNFGDTAKILSTEGDWYKIKTSSGQIGYVANWVVGFGEPDKDSDSSNTASSIAEATIMIDPGHGGSDVGAETRGGVYEKEITLSTANFLKKELEKTGANVIMTRSSDKFIPLESITEMSNRIKPDVFISLHYDSTEGSNVASGTTTYYYYDKYKELAETINTQLKNDLPLPNRGYEYSDLHVTRENTQPALLLELGYLNNDYDATYAISKKYQKQAAQSIAKGLENYFKN